MDLVVRFLVRQQLAAVLLIVTHMCLLGTNIYHRKPGSNRLIPAALPNYKLGTKLIRERGKGLPQVFPYIYVTYICFRILLRRLKRIFDHRIFVNFSPL